MADDGTGTGDGGAQRLQKHQSKNRQVISWVRNNLPLVLTIAAVVLGTILGCLGRMAELSSKSIMLVNFPGEMLMRMLKMVILPLIASSLIIGMAQLDPRSSSRMGYRAVTYYLTTTILAAIVGIIAVVTIHPGDPKIKENVEDDPDSYKTSTLDALLDIVRNLFPENIVQACFQQVQTIYKKEKRSFGRKQNGTSSHRIVSKVIYKDGTNIVGIIVFSIAFGVIAGQLGEVTKTIIDFFVGLSAIIMKMVVLMMWYSPFGIMCLVAGKIMGIDDFATTAQQLGMYMLTVILGLFFHACVTLPAIYFFMTRKNPAKFFQGMLQAYFFALGTGSSSATMPITLKCLEENLGIDPRVAQFVIPVGATVNMDGTALYEAVAVIFIAQANNISLTLDDVIVVSLTATLASIGAASIPSAGLVTMLMILTALGLPTSDVSLIFAVDWFLDRIRTSINVLGDAFGAGIVYHLSKAELDQMDSERSATAMHSHAAIILERDSIVVVAPVTTETQEPSSSPEPAPTPET